MAMEIGSPDAADLTAKDKKALSAIERFQFFRSQHTPAWYAERMGYLALGEVDSCRRALFF